MGISREQALECFRSDDLIGIGMEADAVRRRLHPEGVVSYSMDRSIDCTALLSSGTRGGSIGANPLLDGLYDAIGETIEMGGTGVRLVDGVDARGPEWKALGIEWIEEIFCGIRQRFPSIWIEGLSASEIVALATGCGLGLRATIARLRDAGLDSIASDNANNLGVAEWIEVHRAAHALGMQTVATMPFGLGTGQTGAPQTLEYRVDFLQAVRRLQEETGGFIAFVPQSLSAWNAATGGWDGPTAVEQLKTLAISRIFLDNIENIQSCRATQGLKVIQTGLRFGSNDAGSVTLLVNGAKSGNGADACSGTDVAAAGIHASEEDLRHIIRDAGFQPVQRDTLYRTLFLN